MPHCDHCGHDVVEGAAFCRACGARLLTGSGSPVGSGAVPASDASHAGENLALREGRRRPRLMMTGGALVLVIGGLFGSKSILGSGRPAQAVHGTALALAGQTATSARASSATATAVARGTQVAQVAQVHLERTIDAQVSASQQNLHATVTAGPQQTATVQAQANAAARARRIAQRAAGQRLTPVHNSDGSRGLYDPSTGIAADAGSPRIGMRSVASSASKGRVYLWVTAVEINGGTGPYASNPQHFMLVGSRANEYQANVGAPHGAALSPASLSDGGVNQGFLGFDVPSRPGFYALVWHEQPGNDWRVLCHIVVGPGKTVRMEL